MDLDEFRDVLHSNRVDIWSMIDAAITVAVLDYGDELKDRRDGIVERLYAASAQRCRNCDESRGNTILDGAKAVKEPSPDARTATPYIPQFVESDQDHQDQNLDRNEFLSGNDEQTRIVSIKEYLEDSDKPEDSILELLQELADMDMTFESLQDSDIGRYVNRLRKHSSAEVRRLAKQLVREWKDIVDEWVKQGDSNEMSSSPLIAADGDSPQQKLHQPSNSAYSPNPINGNSGFEKNNTDPEVRNTMIRKEQSPPSVSLKKRDQDIDAGRLASARKRLQQNYQEAENAKKQRTIRMMDIHEIPKPKNAFFGKNRGFHGRH